MSPFGSEVGILHFGLFLGKNSTFGPRGKNPKNGPIAWHGATTHDVVVVEQHNAMTHGVMLFYNGVMVFGAML
jgi:hypothetical protein